MPSILPTLAQTPSTSTTSKKYGDNYGEGWDALSRSVKARDGNACLSCGSTQGPLHTHHVIPKSKLGVDAKRNLITLCEVCHQRRHHHSLSPHKETFGNLKVPKSWKIKTKPKK